MVITSTVRWRFFVRRWFISDYFKCTCAFYKTSWFISPGCEWMNCSRDKCTNGKTVSSLVPHLVGSAICQRWLGFYTLYANLALSTHCVQLHHPISQKLWQWTSIETYSRYLREIFSWNIIRNTRVDNIFAIFNCDARIKGECIRKLFYEFDNQKK